MIKRLPVIGPSATHLVRRIRARQPEPFDTSGSYWERRYQTGGNSGAGSYGRLARFKAEVVNSFVRDHGVETVLEIGCGDGAQLELAQYPSYIGVDVSSAAVDLCKSKFAADPSKRFYLSQDVPAGLTADLVLSLDVIYHLIEDDVFDNHMASLFDHANRHVIIYASDEDRQPPDQHVKHRKFTDWVARFRPDWRLIETVPNAYPFDPAHPDDTSFADFYIYENVVV